MDSLEKRSYDVYVQNLTLSKKKRLVEKILESVDEEYATWCAAMKQFLKVSNINRLFKVYSEFEGYSVSRKKAVLGYDDRLSFRAFYVTVPGEIQVTHWGDMGFPDSETVKIGEIHNWCEKRNIKDLEKALDFFAATHPDLKQ